jgi:Fe-Mn family superoxide dismutase
MERLMFVLPALPYAEDALSPHMSPVTVNTHHKKHHAGYVTKANDALAKKGWTETRLEDAIARARSEGDKFLFNQTAQIWNHTFFWNSMTPTYAAPSGDLAEALKQAFGDQEALQKQFIEKGEKHFASGWVWLVSDASGKVSLTDTHDADTLADQGQTPLLVCDVWEHAYYLDHKNMRGAFLEVFVSKLANWSFAAKQYDAARGKGAKWEHPRAEAKVS